MKLTPSELIRLRNAMLETPLEPVIFEPRTHTYTLGGVVIPGVTSIMGPYIGQDFSMVDAKVLAEASLLGQRAHAVIHEDVKHDGIEEGEVDFDMIPYLEGWHEFRHKSGFEPLLTEHLVYSKKYGYAGQLDLFGHIDGQLLLPDVKRVAMVSKAAAVQTAAYLNALCETYPALVECCRGGATIDRAALQIDKYGKCTLIPFSNAQDFRVFLSCLNIHNFKRGAL